MNDTYSVKQATDAQRAAAIVTHYTPHPHSDARSESAANQPERSALSEMLHTLDEMHKVTSDLHTIADRACGIAGEDDNSPKPLPHGMLGEVTDSMHTLRERLYSLHRRLSRIA